MSGLLLVAAAYPALLPPDADSFPLSTYPMFAKARPARVEVISALAIGDSGEQPVPPSYIANAEAMQALQTLRKSVAAGRRSARALCARIAAEVTRRQEPAFAAAHAVAIVTTRVDVLGFLERGAAAPAEQQGRKVHVRCEVPGRAARGTAP